MMNNQELNELARQKRCEYYRKWRADNKERVKEYNQNYWRKKLARQMEEVKEDDE